MISRFRDIAESVALHHQHRQRIFVPLREHAVFSSHCHAASDALRFDSAGIAGAGRVVLLRTVRRTLWASWCENEAQQKRSLNYKAPLDVRCLF